MTTEGGLAYTFWHWKQPQISATEYEARQRDFHSALAADPPSGFLCSVSSAVTGAPWANGGAEAYQDRYVIGDSSALDALDRAVASGMYRQAHDNAAAVAESGIAGLYRARIGVPLPAPRHAVWFAKPSGMSYDQLLARCEPLVRPDDSVLWMRRMVLGPTPEFCLESMTPVTLPPELRGLALSLRPVWQPTVRAK